MGLFSQSTSPLDPYVEKATSEKNTNDDWALIVDVCDKINEGATGVTDGLKAILKRLKHDTPRVQLQAITLLDACISNCGKEFLLKVSEREFEQELYKLLTCAKTHYKVSERLRECVKKWAEGDFKGDTQLGLIPALYMKMQQQGYSFDSSSDVPKQQQKFSTDPNVVQSQQEEDDIVKAIQLSLQDTGSNGYKAANQQKYATETKKESGGLYSSATAALASEFSGAVAASVPEEKEPMKVRALYDFEAVEDNELTFKAGEIIVVRNHNDANWWEGSNHRGDGLFPSNFVTDKLYEEEETKLESSSGGKKVSFSEAVEVTEVREDFPTSIVPTGEIDEEKINHLLHILHEADPTAERPDDPTLPQLEEQVNAMAPTIDVELEQIDRMHAQLARISTDLVGGLGLYDQLMREMPPAMQYYSPYNHPAMQPVMTGHVADPNQAHYMQPAAGMHHQMYQPPSRVQQQQYMRMAGPDSAYLQSAIPPPPHTQADGTAQPPQQPPPAEYPQGQPQTSYAAPPVQGTYTQYDAPPSTTFAPPQSIYSQVNMSQGNVAGMMPYPMSGVMDPNMMMAANQMPPQMHQHLPPQANPGQHYMQQPLMHGHVGPYPSNMPPTGHPAADAVVGMPTSSLPAYEPTNQHPHIMHQPLL